MKRANCPETKRSPLLILLMVLLFGLVAIPNPAHSQNLGASFGHNSPASNSEVLAFGGDSEGWAAQRFADLSVGQEFQLDGELCFIDKNGSIKARTGVDLALLPEADRRFDTTDWRFPEPEDVVRFIGEDNGHLRHDRMGTLRVGDRFFFQGRLYTAEVDAGSPTGLAVRNTGIVLSRVTDAFQRKTDRTLDLTIADESGNETVITGTPEHPFFVPAVGDYVAMGDLQSDTILKTDDGSLATVKSSKTREGDFSVYNFEVEGTHNYFVASADGRLMVNVHNQCKIVGSTKHIDLVPADNGAYMILLDDGKAYIGKGGTSRARQSARRISRERNSPVDAIAHWPTADDASAFAKEAELIDSVGGIGAPDLLNLINSPGNAP